MKRLIIILSALVLLLNVSFGLIISKYPLFNMVVNGVVIFSITIFLLLTYCLTIKDGYKISLSFLFVAMGVFQVVLGCRMPACFQDNCYLLIELLCVCIECSMLIIANFMSNKINN